MGAPGQEVPAMTNVHGRTVQGGTFPAEMWRDFMERIAPLRRHDCPEVVVSDFPGQEFGDDDSLLSSSSSSNNTPQPTSPPVSTSTGPVAPPSVVVTPSQPPTSPPTSPPSTVVPPGPGGDPGVSRPPDGGSGCGTRSTTARCHRPRRPCPAGPRSRRDVGAMDLDEVLLASAAAVTRRWHSGDRTGVSFRSRRQPNVRWTGGGCHEQRFDRARHPGAQGPR